MSSVDELNELMKLYEENKKKEEEYRVSISQLSQELISSFFSQFPPLKKVDRLVIKVSTISQWLRNQHSKGNGNYD